MAKIGKYEVVRQLATGGMAEVFLAKTGGALGFEKMVVVKRIRQHLLGDPQFLQMFLNEAKIAAQLNHPNIVQVFDFGEEEDEYYLAMEYIDGPNLRTLSSAAHKAGKPISFPLCAKILSYACEGLAYAHEYANAETNQPMDIVHRDVSPDNIVVAKNGAVKVVDFGIAKAAEQLYQTQSGLRKGKLAYMSPEYVKGGQPDRRSDVFALGVVLYELIGNKKPYDTENEIALMHAMVYEPMVSVRVRRPDIPGDLESIVKKALAKDPDERYQSCREMQEDLERFVVDHGEPLSAVHISRVVASLQAEVEAAALAKTPNRAKSPPVAGSTPAGQKTPAKRSSGEKRIPGASGEKPGGSGEKPSLSGEKRSPSGEKRKSVTPAKPVSVPEPGADERTIRMTSEEFVAKAAAEGGAAVEQGLEGLRKAFAGKVVHGEGSSSAPTMEMRAASLPPIATPVRFPSKPYREEPRTESEMPRVVVPAPAMTEPEVEKFEPEPREKTEKRPSPARGARARPPVRSRPPQDPQAARKNVRIIAIVAVALLLLGGGIALVVLRPSPEPPPEPKRVEVQPPVDPAPPPPQPPDPGPTQSETSEPPKVEEQPAPTGVLEIAKPNVSAAVKIDGKRRGKLTPGQPYRVALPPGKHDVEIFDPDTKNWIKRWAAVEIKLNGLQKLEGEVAKGTIKVSSPGLNDAEVFVDKDQAPRVSFPNRWGGEVLKEKLVLNEGLHQVRFVSKKLAKSVEQEITVEPGKETPVAPKFQ